MALFKVEVSGVLVGVLIGLALGVAVMALLKRNGTGVAAVPMARALPVGRYRNDEKWEFVKDERGRVLGVEVHRDATRE